MGHPKFLIKKTKSGQFRFNLTAKNGQTILSSENYTTKSACENGIESVKKNSTDDNRFERATAKNGEFYFNLKSTNGQVVGTSEMYKAKSSMESGIESVKTNAKLAEAEEEA
jgi:uncharacterized protein YegP (UPF0339 family)